MRSKFFQNSLVELIDVDVTAAIFVLNNQNGGWLVFCMVFFYENMGGGELWRGGGQWDWHGNDHETRRMHRRSLRLPTRRKWAQSRYLGTTAQAETDISLP